MSACDGMVHLRRARDEDARGMAEVHVGAWREAFRYQESESLVNVPDVDLRRRQWSDELRVTPPDRRPWVADADGTIIGFVTCGPARETRPSSLVGELYGVYVLPECWDRGVGRSLLSHSVRDLAKHGYTEAILWCPAGNARARDFYERAGWNLDGGTRDLRIGSADVAEVRYRLMLERSRVAELV